LHCPHQNIENFASRKPLETSYDETTNLDTRFEGGWDSAGIEYVVDCLGFTKPIVMFDNGSKCKN
jgi:hypothetical protein